MSSHLIFQSNSLLKKNPQLIEGFFINYLLDNYLTGFPFSSNKIGFPYPNDLRPFN